MKKSHNIPLSQNFIWVKNQFLVYTSAGMGPMIWGFSSPMKTIVGLKKPHLFWPMNLFKSKLNASYERSVCITQVQGGQWYEVFFPPAQQRLVIRYRNWPVHTFETLPLVTGVNINWISIMTFLYQYHTTYQWLNTLCVNMPIIYCLMYYFVPKAFHMYKKKRLVLSSSGGRWQKGVTPIFTKIRLHGF